MGNLLSTNKHQANIYEPFVNHPDNHLEKDFSNQIILEDKIQKLYETNRLLEEEVRVIKREMDERTSRIDTSMQIKYNELLNSISYYNEKTNEKIGIITKDMENLLNNDKILLDKLIEKNIVSTIQDA
jgi:hypothetical protein